LDRCGQRTPRQRFPERIDPTHNNERNSFTRDLGFYLVADDIEMPVVFDDCHIGYAPRARNHYSPWKDLGT